MRRKKTSENMGMQVNLGKTKVMKSGAKRAKNNSKVDSCAKCGKRMMAICC